MSEAKLLGVLAAQLALVAVVWALRTDDSGTPEAFLQFDAAAVDLIAVSGADGSVTLRRFGDLWRLPGGLPADPSKIERVLDKLADADGGWPVGTSAAALARFEVTAEAHQRRLTLRSGQETLADLYLGTSPGYQKTHARHAAGGDAYAIGFSNYEAGLTLSDWLKKSLLQPEGKLQSISREDAGWRLVASEEGWTAEDATLNQEEAATFAGRFEGFNVLDFADATSPDEPKMRFALTDDRGDYELAFHQLEEDDYVVTSSRFEGAFFELAAYIVEQLDKSLEDLTVTTDAPAADAGTDAGEEDAAPSAPTDAA